ncbi:MAG TPA: septum formation initiator family protein [Candidatus Gastranaerophilaceae bacterium]|nr:septum formation initiator family protein [Candidatus Gastranaerophilaceae bacterium]HPT40946.1 septum formation initiator family protein [Candidatus Gastranaerophilaceae bacterium]
MTKESDKSRKKRNSTPARNVHRANNPENETLIDKTKIKNKQRKNRIRFYYSFLTVVLLICIAQIGFSAILNISKTISYQTKIATMKKTKNQAEVRNKKLKEEIDNFSSASSLEAIARNNLKMAGQDEVLVIINTAQEANSEKSDKKNNKTKKPKSNKNKKDNR